MSRLVVLTWTCRAWLWASDDQERVYGAAQTPNFARREDDRALAEDARERG